MDAAIESKIHYLNSNDLDGSLVIEKIAEAAASAETSTVLEVLDQVQARRAEIKDPNAWVCAALRKRAKPDGQQTKTSSEKLEKRIRWLNTLGGFNDTLNYEALEQAAQGVDVNAAMKVLKELEEKREQVKDPTAYASNALRKLRPTAAASPMAGVAPYELAAGIGWAAAAAHSQDDAEQQLRNKVDNLNREGGFDGSLNYQKLSEAARGVSVQDMMKLFDDLEQKKDTVQDPTAYVAHAFRKKGGNVAHDWHSSVSFSSAMPMPMPFSSAVARSSALPGAPSRAMALPLPLSGGGAWTRTGRGALPLPPRSAGGGALALPMRSVGGGALPLPTRSGAIGALPLPSRSVGGSAQQQYQQQQYQHQQQYQQQQYQHQQQHQHQQRSVGGALPLPTRSGGGASALPTRSGGGALALPVRSNGGHAIGGQFARQAGGGQSARGQPAWSTPSGVGALPLPSGYSMAGYTPVVPASIGPVFGDDPALDQKLQTKVTWLNERGGFAGNVNYEKIAAAAVGIEISALMSLFKDLEQKKDQVRDPTGWVVMALRKRGGGGGMVPNDGLSPDNGLEAVNMEHLDGSHMMEGDLQQQLDWMNSNGGFEGKLIGAKVLEAAVGVDGSEVMRIFQELETKAGSIRDPTAYVTSAFRKAKGGMKRPAPMAGLGQLDGVKRLRH